MSSRAQYMEALDEATNFIAQHTGSCPLDSLGIEPHDQPCDTVCHMYTSQMEFCWSEYFIQKAKDVHR